MTAEVELGDEFPAAVYRLYATDGTLLYVGVTGNLGSRFATHAKNASWWPQVARRTAVSYDTRTEALGAEAIAIRDEFPVHNRVNPLAPDEPRPRSRGRNKTPLIGWHSADYTLKPWIETEAEERGITIRELLDEALARYRADPPAQRTLRAV